MNKYMEIHEENGMRHSGLVPSKAERERDRYISKLLTERDRLKAVNAELLAALERAYQVMHDDEGYRTFNPVMKQMSVAIAKAKGEA